MLFSCDNRCRWGADSPVHHGRWRDRLNLDWPAPRVFFAANFSGGQMATAFVFPGQGSQSVGMGRALAQAFPAARQVFEEVDDALGEKLSAVIWEGPLDRLTLTENAQPALMAASLAAIRVLE